MWATLEQLRQIVLTRGIILAKVLPYHCCNIFFPEATYLSTSTWASFATCHGARQRDFVGGKTVTHANASRQLCVCLLAISCVLGRSDIGSCPLWFLSPEHGEDPTLTQKPPAQLDRAPALENQKKYSDIISERSQRIFQLVTQSRSPWHNWWLM